MSDLERITREIAALFATRGVRLAELARRQHGVVATWQLSVLGYSRHQIRAEVEAGRLHRVRRGVYAVGHMRLSLRGRWMAAVLACGCDALLSHRAAAALHNLRPPPSGPTDVTVPGRNASRAGVRVHNVRSLHPDDCGLIDGIPVTALPRTLLDYAEVAGEQWVRLAIEEAHRQQVFDMGPILTLVARSPGRRGMKPLQAALARVAPDPPWMQSEPERRLLVGLRLAGAPEPSANTVVEGELVDFHFPHEGLIVEVDGDRWHRTRAAREADRRRDVKLQLAGKMVARFSAQRVNDELTVVVGEILRLLARRRAELSRGAAAASGP